MKRLEIAAVSRFGFSPGRVADPSPVSMFEVLISKQIAMQKNPGTRRDAIGLVTVAIAFIFAILTVPVQAQFTPQLSNASGVIASSSSIAGGTLSPVNHATPTFRARFSTSGTRRLVYNTASHLNRSLEQEGPSSSTVAPHLRALSKATRTMLGSVLQGESSESDSYREALSLALAQDGADEDMAQSLARSLDGLTKREHVSPSKLIESLEAFNQLVRTASPEFLMEPSEEFQGTHAVLSTLADAASR